MNKINVNSLCTTNLCLPGYLLQNLHHIQHCSQVLLSQISIPLVLQFRHLICSLPPAQFLLVVLNHEFDFAKVNYYSSYTGNPQSIVSCFCYTHTLIPVVRHPVVHLQPRVSRLTRCLMAAWFSGLYQTMLSKVLLLSKIACLSRSSLPTVRIVFVIA